MNDIKLIGRMVREPEVKQSQSGKSFVKFTMAVPRRFKSADGNIESDFPSCTAYGKTAELIGKYIKKGHKFLAEGEIRTSQYQKDGRTVYVTEMLVNSVEFLEQKSTAAESQAPTSEDIPYGFESIDEDIPF